MTRSGFFRGAAGALLAMALVGEPAAALTVDEVCAGMPDAAARARCVKDETAQRRKEAEFLKQAEQFNGQPTAPSLLPDVASDAGQRGGALLLGVVLVLAVGVLYFLPTVVAYRRRHRNVLAIGVLNVFLGWTLIGWVAALVWSVTKDAQPAATA